MKKIILILIAQVFLFTSIAWAWNPGGRLRPAMKFTGTRPLSANIALYYMLHTLSKHIETGFDVEDTDIIYRTRTIRRLLDILTPEVLDKISKGNILLLGSGRHIHEVSMLFDIFPDIKGLYVVDKSLINLRTIKKLLKNHRDKIHLCCADIGKLPFQDGQFTICYSRGVFDRNNEDLFRGVKEVGRVLAGVYITIWSDTEMFKKIFTVRSFDPYYLEEGFFIASRYENVFLQPPIQANDNIRGSL